jgi:hypothetical protein
MQAEDELLAVFRCVGLKRVDPSPYVRGYPFHISHSIECFPRYEQ